MDLEKIRELISKSKAFAANDSCRQLVDQFEEFVELYHQKERFQGDVQYLKKLDESHKKFWDSFEKVASSFGLTGTDVRAFIENANNFSPQQWQYLQALKQQIMGEPSATPTHSVKKLKKTKNKLRV